MLIFGLTIFSDEAVKNLLAVLHWVVKPAACGSDQSIFGAVAEPQGLSAADLRKRLAKYLTRSYKEVRLLDVEGRGKEYFGNFLIWKF